MTPRTKQSKAPPSLSPPVADDTVFQSDGSTTSSAPPPLSPTFAYASPFLTPFETMISTIEIATGIKIAVITTETDPYQSG